MKPNAGVQSFVSSNAGVQSAMTLNPDMISYMSSKPGLQSYGGQLGQVLGPARGKSALGCVEFTSRSNQSATAQTGRSATSSVHVNKTAANQCDSRMKSENVESRMTNKNGKKRDVS